MKEGKKKRKRKQKTDKQTKEEVEEKKDGKDDIEVALDTAVEKPQPPKQAFPKKESKWSLSYVLIDPAYMFSCFFNISL